MIEFPADPARNRFLQAWIEQRLQSNLGQCACLGVWRNERLIAVCAYNKYTTYDIEISFAADSPRWATKQVVTWLLSYPFVQLKTQRVTALVKKSNRRARKLLVGIGFKEEGTHKHAAANLETVFSYGLLRGEFTERYLADLRAPSEAREKSSKSSLG